VIFFFGGGVRRVGVAGVVRLVVDVTLPPVLCDV
jgi:hypothetical protein